MKSLLKGSSLFVFFAFIFAFLQISCKKDDTQPTTYSVQGLWTGTYSVNDLPSQGQLFYSFVFYPDGTVVTRGKIPSGTDAYGYGAWSMSSSNIITCTVVSQGVTQKDTLTYSNTGVLTNGSWSDPYHTGKFSSMQKAN